MHSFVQEREAAEHVSLRDEQLDASRRPVERRLSDDDVRAAGLLKDRVIEVSEMREEPVISKTAVVREEVVLTKNVTEQVETIRDTVRHTEVEVEELTDGRAGAAHRPMEERRS